MGQGGGQGEEMGKDWFNFGLKNPGAKECTGNNNWTRGGWGGGVGGVD